MLEIKNERVTTAEAQKAEVILSNLPTLNEALRKISLDEVRKLIKVEADGKHRMTTLQRLIARYNVLEGKENEGNLMQYVVAKHNL